MKISKEIQIAGVAILGVVVLFFGLQFLKGLSVFSTDDTYYVAFDDVSGLSSSSPVYVNGFKVGVVKDVVCDYQGGSGIFAVLGLDKNVRLPKGSSATISSDMLGNVQLNIRMEGDPTRFMAPGDTLKGSTAGSLMESAGALLPDVQRLLPKLDSIAASLNALLADPALANSLHNVDQITANLVVSSRQLNTMMGGLNSQLPKMMTKADGLLDSATRLTDKAGALDLEGTMAKVDATLASAQQMTEAINSREGTIGLLLHDPTLYRNLSATMGSADSLLVDLKSHPKRYVHFSLFGRKDK